MGPWNVAAHTRGVTRIMSEIKSCEAILQRMTKVRSPSVRDLRMFAKATDIDPAVFAYWYMKWLDAEPLGKNDDEDMDRLHKYKCMVLRDPEVNGWP